jgi:hypothetical protein
MYFARLNIRDYVAWTMYREQVNLLIQPHLEVDHLKLNQTSLVPWPPIYSFIFAKHLFHAIQVDKTQKT